MRKPCEYRDREGNRGAGCVLEFEVNGGPGGSNRKHCDVCQKLAVRDRGAAHRAAEDPEKRRKRQRDRRKKTAQAARRGYRTMTSMQPCEYRDREGNPSKACRGEFKPRSGIQIYCENCRPLARRDRQKVAALALYHADAREYKAGRRGKAFARHERRLKRGRKSAANYNKRLRELAANGKILADLSSKPAPWRKIVPLLRINPNLSNEQAQTLAGTSLSSSAMNRVRQYAGVPGRKGQPRKRL